MRETELEPVLDWDEIQGNVLSGANKDHQYLLGLRFGADLRTTRQFVRRVAEQTTSLRTMVEHKRHRASFVTPAGREAQTEHVALSAAFSFAGLERLRDDADAFTDLEFRQGLAASSAELGDPAEGAFGSPSTWCVGGPDNVPDLLLILAADRARTVIELAEAWSTQAAEHGASTLYHEAGHDLSHYVQDGHDVPSGHEHFGFKDGISQPGVRGTLPDGGYLEARQAHEATDGASTVELSLRGRPLVCAGQFVLGYSRQVDSFPRLPRAARPLGDQPGSIAPQWAANGSFLVFRRLRQYVAAFRAFTDAAAAAVGRPDVDAARVAAMVVGRWPSGTPLEHSPDRDEPTNTRPELFNAFGYGRTNDRYGLPTDNDGVRCPVSAHIRKVNPRDLNTDLGAASATLSKYILRRGIPYGRPFAQTGEDDDSVDRGLLFLSYQASICDQFEFLCSRWMNSRTLPTDPSAGQGLGHDMLVGQENGPGRVREATLRFGTASDFTETVISSQGPTLADWVLPTGGAYFFAPSIGAMRDVLGKP